MSVQAIPWTQGLELGMGMNSFTQGITRDVAVVFTKGDKANGKSENGDIKTTEEGGEGGAAQKVEYSYTQIKSQSEMVTALNISAALAIKTGGIQASGAGSFINEEKANKAYCNFLLRCVVRNHYNDKPSMKFQWNGIPKNESEFLEQYGDSFVYRLVEGGEFIAVVSINTEDSAKSEKIAAELKVALSVVSGEGQGKYDLSTMKKLSNTTVSVQYSGAMDVNKDGKEWDIELMLKEASEFPAKCAKARTPISALLMKYTALGSFQNLKLQFSPPSYDRANDIASGMLNDSQALKMLRSDVEIWAARLKSGQLKKEQLTISPLEEAYQPTEQGFVEARGDIDKAIAVIRKNTDDLTANPPKVDAKTKTTIADYLKADTIRSRLPAETQTTIAKSLQALAGTSVVVAHFVDKGAHNLRLYWQQSNNAIVQAVYNGVDWLPTLTTIVAEASANTPIAVIASSTGEEIRLFYLDSSGRLTDAVIQAGEKKFSDGGLNSSPLATTVCPSSKLAAVQYGDGSVRLFFQAAADATIKSASCTNGKWEATPDGPTGVVAALGSGLAAIVTKIDSAKGTAWMSLFLQNSIDGTLEEWRFDPDAQPDPNNQPKNWTSVPSRVFPTTLPVGTGVCAFMDGTNPTIAALSRSNAVKATYFEADKNAWTAPKTLFPNGIQSSGLAMLVWSDGSGTVKRMYLQVQNGSPDVCELRWDSNTKAWAESASPLTVIGEKERAAPS